MATALHLVPVPWSQTASHPVTSMITLLPFRPVTHNAKMLSLPTCRVSSALPFPIAGIALKQETCSFPKRTYELSKYSYAPPIPFILQKDNTKWAENQPRAVQSPEEKQNLFSCNSQQQTRLYTYFASKVLHAATETFNPRAKTSTADEYKNKKRLTIRDCHYSHTLYCISGQKRLKKRADKV